MVNITITTPAGEECYELATAAEFLPILEGLIDAVDSTIIETLTLQLTKTRRRTILPQTTVIPTAKELAHINAIHYEN